MQRIEFRAMGCQMLAVVDSDDAAAAATLAQVPNWFAEWEGILSRFKEQSELSRLNGAEGQAVRVSETLWQVIQHALAAAQSSEGLVTPTVLEALEAAGYDRSFEMLPAKDWQVTRGTVHLGDWREIECDAAARTVRLPRGVRLDLGGIAKGWAADMAAQRLGHYSPALVDAGGDIATGGARANGESWPVGVADPLDAEHDLAVLKLDYGAVATSGRDYRNWLRNGRAQHHIIDPRTGYPAETDVLSATVVAPTAVRAEMAAKVALILGSKRGLEWVEARTDLAALLVLESGEVVMSRRFEEYIEMELNDVIPSK